MEKVDVREISAYCWECPKCGDFNIDDIYNDIICSSCGEEFELGKVE